MKWAATFLLIAACGAAGPASRPATRPAEQWELTKYLHGSTSQVRDQLNGELERQLIRKADTLKQIDALSKELKKQEAEAIEFTRTRPDYLKLKRERDEAEQALKIARESGTAQQKLEASGRYNRARVALEKMEKDAPATYTQAADLRAKLKDLDASLKRSDEAIGKATEWRDELLDSTINAFKLVGPFHRGDEGVLKRVTCDKIIDAQSAIVSAELQWGKGERVGEKEGISLMEVHFRRVKFSVTGIDTSHMREGQDFALNRNVRIVKGDGGGGETLAEHHVNDVDQLIDTIIPLRVPANVLPGPVKLDATPIGGVRGLAELLPIEQLTAIGKASAFMQEFRAQKWLDEHAIGRSIRLTGVLQAAKAEGNEYDVSMAAERVKVAGGAFADAPEIHALFAKSHEALLTRTGKGQRLAIQGTLQRLTVFVDNGTIVFELHLSACEPAK
jgi:hypothetical protein